MSKPIDFICVGTQKAGTTTLHDVLKHHPNIYLPDFAAPTIKRFMLGFFISI